MKVIFISLALISSMVTSPVFAQQQRVDSALQQKIYLEKEAKRLQTVKLEIATSDSIEGEPKQTFLSDADIWIHMTASNDDSEPVGYGVSNKYHQFFPQLMKDGQLLSYLPKVQEEIDDETIPLMSSTHGIKIPPYKQKEIAVLSLKDWYGELAPGFYDLTLQHNFRRGGPRLTSNTITFEIVAR